MSNAAPHFPPKPAQPTLPRLRCLLCGAADLRAVWELSGREVRQLWLSSDRHLSEAAYGVLFPSTPVILSECPRCGFRAFDPQLAGGQTFYEELERAGYYVDYRPEFDFTLDLCGREGVRKVLDVGGGQGA